MEKFTAIASGVSSPQCGQFAVLPMLQRDCCPNAPADFLASYVERCRLHLGCIVLRSSYKIFHKGVDFSPESHWGFGGSLCILAEAKDKHQSHVKICDLRAEKLALAKTWGRSKLQNLQLEKFDLAVLSLGVKFQSKAEYTSTNWTELNWTELNWQFSSVQFSSSTCDGLATRANWLATQFAVLNMFRISSRQFALRPSSRKLWPIRTKEVVRRHCGNLTAIRIIGLLPRPICLSASWQFAVIRLIINND
jgi:hypothetical protein